MNNVTGSDLPIGHSPGSKSLPCSRLAILFHWASSNSSKWQHDSNMSRTHGRVRTISTSLELELKMLSITDVFAVFVCP